MLANIREIFYSFDQKLLSRQLLRILEKKTFFLIFGFAKIFVFRKPPKGCVFWQECSFFEMKNFPSKKALNQGRNMKTKVFPFLLISPPF